MTASSKRKSSAPKRRAQLKELTPAEREWLFCKTALEFLDRPLSAFL